MRRREFIGLVGSAATWPLVARAQQTGRMARIGMLSSRRVNAVLAAGYQAFIDELRKLGFSEGRNVIIDERDINQDVTGLYASAAELAHANPDVIVTSGPEVALEAAIAASSTIPIVMLAINYDPIARRYIKSLAHPGGNVSGVFLRQTELAEKQMELLTQTFPERECVGIIWDRASIDQLAAAERRAKALGLEVRSLEMEKPPYDFDVALQTVVADGAQMVLFLSSIFFAMQSRRIAELGIQRRLPSMFVFRGYVQDGGLMSYGANPVEMYRQTATYVAKILRGAKPADLPVEQPKAFDLVVNLKTAKAIGVELPTSILLRANEVIE
jgi:putative ABC transport system substrate-binding protein